MEVTCVPMISGSNITYTIWLLPSLSWPEAECPTLYTSERKMLSLLLLCWVVASGLLSLLPVSFFSPAFSWNHFRNKPLRAFVTTEIYCRNPEKKENCSLVFHVLCRYTNPVDHHLPALCPPWVGDNWLVIIRHDYGYYFHFKKIWRLTVQGHRGKRHLSRCIPPAGRQSNIWTAFCWGTRAWWVIKTDA